MWLYANNVGVGLKFEYTVLKLLMNLEENSSHFPLQAIPSTTAADYASPPPKLSVERIKLHSTAKASWLMMPYPAKP